MGTVLARNWTKTQTQLSRSVWHFWAATRQVFGPFYTRGRNTDSTTHTDYQTAVETLSLSGWISATEHQTGSGNQQSDDGNGWSNKCSYYENYRNGSGANERKISAFDQKENTLPQRQEMNLHELLS